MAQEQEKAYYGQILQNQIAHYQMRLGQATGQANNDVLSQECAVCLAEIATRVQVIEELLVAESRVSKQDVVSSEPSQWQEHVSVSAEAMSDIANLHNVEHHDGKTFRWSGAEPVIQFVLPVLRDKPTELCLDIVAVMKPEFIQSLKLTVDGAIIKHRAREVDGMIQVFAKLPKAATQKPTQVTVTLPETTSPAELGNGNDMRKLGIAIAQVTIKPAVGRIKRLLA